MTEPVHAGNKLLVETSGHRFSCRNRRGRTLEAKDLAIRIVENGNGLGAEIGSGKGSRALAGSRLGVAGPPADEYELVQLILECPPALKEYSSLFANVQALCGKLHHIAADVADRRYTISQQNVRAAVAW